MTIRNALLATAGLFAIASTPATSAPPLPIDVAAQLFGARPSTTYPDLSPKGDKIVYVVALRGRANVVRVLDLQTKQKTNIIASKGTPDSITWCEFASEDWIVCQYRADMRFQGSIVGASRLIAIDLRTKQSKELGVESDFREAATIRQSDGSIISYPDDGPPSVVMARNYVRRRDQQDVMHALGPPVSIGVDRIALDTMKVTRIDAPNPLIEGLLTDPSGNPRIQESAQYDNSGQLTGVTVYRFRPLGSNAWMTLSSYDSRNDSGTVPISVEAATNEVFLLRKKNGREALYKQKLEPNSQPVEVAANANYDIDGVVKLRRGGPAIGYAFTADRPEVSYFDPSYAKVVADLGKVLKDEPFIELSGSSREGSKLLIHSASDRDPGAYYVFDRQKQTLDFALEDRENLGDLPLAPMRRVDIPTPDGHSIPAYLTLPAGRAPNGPAIVLPHGGPSSRDTLGFDWLAQFLAARGYAVIQPNYRGSSGYGDQFLGDNAFKDWRTAIQDIGASADYLVKQGIADPARLAILGWSYGGYAALQSAVMAPAKYKAVVAIAPVTDLSRISSDQQGFTNADLTKDFVGKGKNLREGSPLHHAELIKAPVLLVHGDLDSNVRVAHSQRMQKALRAAGGTVELLEFEGLNHQLSDGDARTQMLTKIGQLLERTIGH
ncbi:MAG: alpha/beta fold hydrolase [Sphingomicrobium sp.]